MVFLRKLQICFGCKKFFVDNPNKDLEEDEVATLKTCTKCKFAKYCSVKCQKNEWKHHKKHCETLVYLEEQQLAIEDEVDGIDDHNEITIKDVENILSEKKILYNIKCVEDYNLLEKYENEDRCRYLEIRLLFAKVYWYLAEHYNSWFLYQKYYYEIKDLMKNCPFLVDQLIYTYIMCLINFRWNKIAFGIINFWNFDFVEEKKDNLVPMLKALLDSKWSTLWTLANLKKYDKFSTVGTIIDSLKVINRMEDEVTKYEAEIQFQLFPFLPAILAIKISNMLFFNDEKEDFEDFVEAVRGDNGQLKIWSQKYPGIIRKIGSMVLGQRARKFNEIVRIQSDDIDGIMRLVKQWKTIELDFLFGGHSDLPEDLLQIPRHFAWEDHHPIERWLRIYGSYFNKLGNNGEESTLTIEERNKLPWWFLPPGYTEVFSYVNDFDLA